MKEQYEKGMLIMGIGNLLMGDEGLGVHFVRRLEEDPAIPEGVEFLDGGTGGFHLMEYFERYPSVILIDATMDGTLPGSISLVQPRFSSDFPRAMSTHDIGLKDLVEGLTILGRLPMIYLFTVSIDKMQEQCIELSPEVDAVYPVLRNKITELINLLQEGGRVAFEKDVPAVN